MNRPADSDATSLDIAIDTISESTLRNLFKVLCKKSSEARRFATERLLVDTSEEVEEFEADGHEARDRRVRQAKPAAATLKRPASRYATCENCKKEFDVTTNSSKSCVYHPKDAEPEGEELFMDNYDEFEVDTPELREELPHCFTFWCCESTLESNPDGCVVDWHRALSTSSKRKRL